MPGRLLQAPAQRRRERIAGVRGELEAKPLDFLEEHENRATGRSMFLITCVSEGLAPAPQSFDLVVFQTHRDRVSR